MEQEPRAYKSLTKEDIAKLPHLACIALAARCAMRIAPAYRGRDDASKVIAANYFRGIELSGNIGASISASGVITEEIEFVAYKLLSHLPVSDLPYNTSAQANVTSASVSRCLLAALATDSFGAAEEASIGIQAAHSIITYFFRPNDFAIATSPFFDDYEELQRLNLGSRGQRGQVVPEGFFQRPLWPSGHPETWEKVIHEWGYQLELCGVGDIFHQHEMLLAGGGFDLAEMERRIREWTDRGQERLDPSSARGTRLSVKGSTKEKDKVDIDVKDANLKDVLDALFTLKPGGIANKIVDPAPYNPITISLEDLDWDTAFQYVLKQAGARYKRDANDVYLVSFDQNTASASGEVSTGGPDSTFDARGSSSEETASVDGARQSDVTIRATSAGSIAGAGAARIIIEPPIPSTRPSLQMLDDDALENDKQDRLGFQAYADALEGLIKNQKTGTPLTVAINAPWGAGKTSLARMVQRLLEKKPIDPTQRPHVTCWFNAWMHDDATKIASAFAAEVAKTAHRRWSFVRRILRPLPWQMQDVGEKLVTSLSLIAVAGGLTIIFANFGLNEKVRILPGWFKDNKEWIGAVFGTSIIAKVIGWLSAAFGNYVRDPGSAATNASMEAVRDSLGKYIRWGTPEIGSPVISRIAELIDQRRRSDDAARGREAEAHEPSRFMRWALPRRSRFVIFVDDLERCKPPRSVELLEVVNQLLSHKDVVTVIIADMPAVAACAEIKYDELTKRYSPLGDAPNSDGKNPRHAFGRLYLQKIVQLQFDIPSHSPEKIRELIEHLSQELQQKNATPEATEKKGPEAEQSQVNVAATGTIAYIRNISVAVDEALTQPSLIAVWLLTTAGAYSIVDRWFHWFAVLLLAILLSGYGALLLRRDRRRSVAIGKANEAIKQKLAAGVIGIRELQAEARRVATFLKDEQTVSLAREARVQHLTGSDDYPLLNRAYDEMVPYLPPMPRHAKRLINHLRLMLCIAVDRRMYDDSLKPEHIGKWVVLRERWPELAQIIIRNPEDVMEALEDQAKEEDSFFDYVKEILPNYPRDGELMRFCQSEKWPLKDIIIRLVRFESAQSASARTSPVQERN